MPTVKNMPAQSNCSSNFGSVSKDFGLVFSFVKMSLLNYLVKKFGSKLILFKTKSN